MGVSWEIAVGLGVLLIIMAIVALVGRGPRKKASRRAHEWMVLRDRIEAMESRIKSLEMTSRPPTSHSSGSGPVPVPAASRLRGQQVSPLIPLPTLISVPDLGRKVEMVPESKVSTATPAPPTDDLTRDYELVCRQAELGHDALSIARELGLSEDRVEMILSLRKQWTTSRPSSRNTQAEPV